MFLDHVVDEIDVEDEEKTPLMLCAAQGFNEGLEELILSGAKVNRQSKFGETPLHFAASGGHHICVETLIRHGADVLIFVTKTQPTNVCLIRDGIDIFIPPKIGLPIHVALRKGHMSCVQLLWKAEYNDVATDLYHDAVESRNIETCHYLKKNGYKHIDGIRDSMSALHAASYYGLVDMVDFLVSSGANLELRGKYGRTPILAAVTGGYADVVKKLIQHGCNINSKDDSDSELSAIHLAAQFGYLACLTEVIEAGADIDVRDNRGLTPLMRAIGSGDSQSATLLIRQNSCLGNLSRNDNDNGSVRHYLDVVNLAIVTKLFGIARLLLECGICYAEEFFKFPDIPIGTRDWHPLRRILNTKNVKSQEAHKFAKWYLDLKQNASCLKHLSRLVVRDCLKSPVSTKLDPLPLPAALKRYVYLDDMCN